MLLTACSLPGLGARPAPTVAPPPPTMTAPAPPTSPPAPTAAPAKPTSPPAPPTTASAPTAAPASPAAAKPAATVSPGALGCQYAPAQRLAQAQDRAIKEASALVASQRWPGVYWTLNDSGNSPTLYALDDEGRNRGSFRVSGAENEDWEALQLGPGKDGAPALYIGDIGDNDRKRKEITIYRVSEPEPFPLNAKASSGRTDDAEAFTLTYPDSAHDAEALLIHPRTGELLIVTKEHIGRAIVYRLPVPLEPRKKLMLERVANLDISDAGVKVDVVNDGAVAPDASRVVIRTYGSSLEYDVPPDATLASIWNSKPRVSRLNDGVQSEGVTYRADGKALITIGEGTPAPMFQMVWGCG
ncbi:MAG: hypothetical protein IT306_04090 [Chloroflexi bacterium]|nr:hypothetical protein [Chloroflexota bacterium]